MSKLLIAAGVAVAGCLAALVADTAIGAWLPKVYARHAWLTSVPPVADP